jgi:peptidoglycan/LPS O-acetylase OafA/YrhL
MAPLYWLALTLVYLFHGPLHDWMHEVHRIFPLPWAGREIDPGRIDQEPGFANIISHYTFIFGLIPKWASNNVLPDWSITLEMQFYLCFPFLALLLRKGGWLTTLILVIVIWQLFARNLGVGLLSSGGPWGWYPMPTVLPLRLGVFYAGMLAALGLHRWYSARRGLPEFCVVLGLCFWADHLLAAFALVFLVWEIKSHFMKARFPALLRLSDSVLRSQPVRHLADASYGIYLCHSIILLGVIWGLIQWTTFQSLEPTHRFCVLVTSSAPLVFLGSLALHRWVEMPGIRMGKRLLPTRRSA